MRIAKMPWLKIPRKLFEDESIWWINEGVRTGAIPPRQGRRACASILLGRQPKRIGSVAWKREARRIQRRKDLAHAPKKVGVR